MPEFTKTDPAQAALAEVQTLNPCSYIDPEMTARTPAKVEVADIPLTFKTLPTEVEPVMARLPEPVMFPADTPASVEVAPVAVSAAPTFKLPLVVMKPVFVIPFWVEVPETRSVPEMVAFPP